MMNTISAFQITLEKDFTERLDSVFFFFTIIHSLPDSYKAQQLICKLEVKFVAPYIARITFSR